MRFGLVADDLTGACDSAVPFLAAGRVVVSFWPCLPLRDAACLAITTESRAEPPEIAYERSRDALRMLKEAGCDVIYRKVDSQLRGNVVEDLRGALAEWDGSCLLAPALPEEGRTTINGVQRWSGGEADLRRMLDDAAVDRVIVRDAATADDLARIAVEVAATPGVMPAGTAGLAAQLPGAFGFENRPTQTSPGCLRPAAVVGTPAAATQASVASERGKTVVTLGPGETPPALDEYDCLLLTGGETASRVLRGLGVEALELTGEAQPRIPIARCLGGRRDGLVVALKAGAFGGPGSIAVALEALTLRA
jgi:uncharacterized protein YgbK (DUF1537 family)